MMSYCFDNEITHPSITDASIKQSSLGSILANSLGITDGINAVIVYDGEVSGEKRSEKIIALLKGASIAEDNPMCRATNHFTNPLKQGDAAKVSDMPLAVEVYCSPWAPWTSNMRWALENYPDTKNTWNWVKLGNVIIRH